MKYPYLQRQLLLSSLLALLVGCAAGGGTTGTGLDLAEHNHAVNKARAAVVLVTGTVRDRHGRPFAHSQVTLDTVRSSETTLTDGAGHFSVPIEVAPQDALTVSLAAPGFAASGEVSLQPNVSSVGLEIRIGADNQLLIK